MIGIGSIHESIYAGKPMICMPVFFDQFKNAMNMVEAGIGLSIDKVKFTPKELSDKLILLLSAISGTLYEQPIVEGEKSPGQIIDFYGIKNSQEWYYRITKNCEKLRIIAVLSSETNLIFAANIIETAATVGVDHLIPLDVHLTLYETYRHWIVFIFIIFGTFTSIRVYSSFNHYIFGPRKKQKVG